MKLKAYNKEGRRININKTLLYNEYIKNKKTIKEIANDLKLGWACVRNNLIRYCIDRRVTLPKPINKSLLKKLYLKKKKSIKEISKILGHSRAHIRSQLIKHKIPIRTISEALTGKRLSKSHIRSMILSIKKNRPRHYINLNCNFCGKQIKRPLNVHKGAIKNKNFRCFCNKKCMSKFRVGSNNVRYGKPSPHRGKHIQLNTGRTHFKLGFNPWNKGKTAKDDPRILSGKDNPRFGKPPNHGKHIKYRGIWMRSSWETKYAKWLGRQGIKWLYEPRTFDLGNTTYTPDFYLTKENLYIEIKGWWRTKGLKKFKAFKKQHPKIKIKVLKQKELQKLGIIL